VSQLFTKSHKLTTPAAVADDGDDEAVIMPVARRDVSASNVR